MPKNFFLRALIGTPIAAAIAYGLFILMATLIAAEYDPDDEKEIRKIERITPEQRD